MAHRKPPIGVCKQCWKPVASGRMCPACREKDRERQRQRRAERKAKGLCPDCGRVKDAAHATCSTCRQGHAATLQKLYAERIGKGLCVSSGDKAVPGKSRCKLCGIARSHAEFARYEERRAEGICVRCGKRPAWKGNVSCRPCRVTDTNRKRRVRIRKQRVAEFRRMFARNTGTVVHQFEHLMRGKPRTKTGETAAD